MSKKIDETITTIENFNHATKSINPQTKMYVQLVGEELGDLVEITEIQLVLPKTFEDKPYLILRAV